MVSLFNCIPRNVCGSFSKWDRGSIAKLNNKDDNGQPCLDPFCTGKGFDKNQCVKILAVAFEYSLDRKNMNGPSNPVVSRTSNNQFYLTLSNAFKCY